MERDVKKIHISHFCFFISSPSKKKLLSPSSNRSSCYSSDSGGSDPSGSGGPPAGGPPAGPPANPPANPPPNLAGLNWTPQEEQLLRRLYNEGHRWGYIAVSSTSVRTRPREASPVSLGHPREIYCEVSRTIPTLRARLTDPENQQTHFHSRTAGACETKRRRMAGKGLAVRANRRQCSRPCCKGGANSHGPPPPPPPAAGAAASAAVSFIHPKWKE